MSPTASFVLANGETAAYVRDQMGHSSIKVTFDTLWSPVPRQGQGSEWPLREIHGGGPNEGGGENARTEACNRTGKGAISGQQHMHLRGKDVTVRLLHPDGKSETLLSVPRYDFNWQIVYYLEKPLKLPQGAKVEVTAHWDNSANNPPNPDPTKTVKWGNQS